MQPHPLKNTLQNVLKETLNNIIRQPNKHPRLQMPSTLIREMQKQTPMFFACNPNYLFANHIVNHPRRSNLNFYFFEPATPYALTRVANIGGYSDNYNTYLEFKTEKSRTDFWKDEIGSSKHFYECFIRGAITFIMEHFLTTAFMNDAPINPEGEMDLVKIQNALNEYLAANDVFQILNLTEEGTRLEDLPKPQPPKKEKAKDDLSKAEKPKVVSQTQHYADSLQGLKDNIEKYGYMRFDEKSTEKGNATYFGYYDLLYPTHATIRIKEYNKHPDKAHDSELSTYGYLCIIEANYYSKALNAEGKPYHTAIAFAGHIYPALFSGFAGYNANYLTLDVNKNTHYIPPKLKPLAYKSDYGNLNSYLKGFIKKSPELFYWIVDLIQREQIPICYVEDEGIPTAHESPYYTNRNDLKDKCDPQYQSVFADDLRMIEFWQKRSPKSLTEMKETYGAKANRLPRYADRSDPYADRPPYFKEWYFHRHNRTTLTLDELMTLNQQTDKTHA